MPELTVEGTPRLARREAREQAFVVYATDAARSIGETARILAVMGHEVPERTLRYWRWVDRWDEKADAVVVQALGVRQQRIVGHVAAAAEQAALWLERLTRERRKPERWEVQVIQMALGAWARVREGATEMGRTVEVVTLSEEERERIRQRWAALADGGVKRSDGGDGDPDWLVGDGEEE